MREGVGVMRGWWGSLRCVALLCAGLVSGPALAQTRIDFDQYEFPLAGAGRQDRRRTV